MKPRNLLLSIAILPILLIPPAVVADDEPDIAALQEAANAGDADAQFQLGSAYQMGDGVKQNDVMAIKWITKAANQGNPDAQYDLGMAYRGGYGVPQDNIISYMWLELAIANGSKKAFDLRRDVSTNMSLSQINEAKYRASHWKPEEPE